MTSLNRIAINAGGGYVPGIDLIVAAVTRAAARKGVEVVAIRNGYDGLLDGEGVELLDPSTLSRRIGPVSTGARIDPFRARQVSAEGMVSEEDQSDEVLAALARLGVGGVISVVGGSAITGLHALTVALKLARKGLRTVCIPKSVESDIAGVPLPFGFDTALNETALLLDRIRIGAREAGRLAVVEVPGEQAGWLALQAGLAAQADAILIPELPADPSRVASMLAPDAALVVVAKGANLPRAARPVAEDNLRASLSPLSDPSHAAGARVFDTAGVQAQVLALDIQRLTAREVIPLSLGQLIRGGSPSALDRQLAAAYGAAAVERLIARATAEVLSFIPPSMQGLAMADALAGARVVPADSALIHAATTLGVILGG